MIRKETGMSQDLILSHGTAVLMGTKLSKCSGIEVSLKMLATESLKLSCVGAPTINRVVTVHVSASFSISISWPPLLTHSFVGF